MWNHLLCALFRACNTGNYYYQMIFFFLWGTFCRHCIRHIFLHWPVQQNSQWTRSENSVQKIANYSAIKCFTFKGQLISKCLLGVFNSPPKKPENNSTWSKDNSVQEACATFFAVCILKLEILQTIWKNKQKHQNAKSISEKLKTKSLMFFV